jgi:hypothetical protein
MHDSARLRGPSTLPYRPFSLHRLPLSNPPHFRSALLPAGAHRFPSCILSRAFAASDCGSFLERWQARTLYRLLPLSSAWLLSWWPLGSYSSPRLGKRLTFVFEKDKLDFVVVLGDSDSVVHFSSPLLHRRSCRFTCLAESAERLAC